MASGSDQDPSTTTAGPDSNDDEALTVLRWVHPSTEQVTVLSDRAVVLGRDPACTTQLETKRVSRRHAEIKLGSKGFVIHDLDSKNGVFVNAERRAASALVRGDVLRLGDFIAVVETARMKGLAGPAELGHGIWGGAAMRKVMDRARRAAEGGANVVLEGEEGTGKRLLSRAIHRWAGRPGAFIEFDAAAGDATSVAVELFGHSAATDGTLQGQLGCVQAADRGTLLLHDVGALPGDVQRELASRIERRALRQSGGPRAVGDDVQFIITTEMPLSELPPERLDPELRLRLDQPGVELLPLRERVADIIPLFVAFMSRHGNVARERLEPELLEHLCLRNWSMNVRELLHVARRLAAEYGTQPQLKLRHLWEMLGVDPDEPAPDEAEAGPAVNRRPPSNYPPDQVAELRAAIERHQGNLTKAAHELGITRPKAYRMLGTMR